MQNPRRNVVRLTPIERQVIEMLCRGVAPKEIGAHLPVVRSHEVTMATARNHAHYWISRARAKLGARTNWQACAIYATLHPDLATTIMPQFEEIPYPNPREV
jgi:FixJ family two-component response regulator